jgi:hypothetical protein
VVVEWPAGRHGLVHIDGVLSHHTRILRVKTMGLRHTLKRFRA